MTHPSPAPRPRPVRRALLRRGVGYLAHLAHGTARLIALEASRQARLRGHARPTVIQLPVNDICNSRCVMCDIWRRKRDHELSPEQLADTLDDPLFARVTHIGLNGGEPTLRKDLPELARACVGRLPRLRSCTMITNAIRTRDVVARAAAVHDVFAASSVAFSVMVSIDGVGDVHDRHRGVPGNFEHAVDVIRQLRERGVAVETGCTLTNGNCDGADDVLRWAQGLDPPLPVVFRLGVEIKRLYNLGFTDDHGFSREQRFHVINFFDKLARQPDLPQPRRRIYRSLIGQMEHGAPRRCGCAWQTDGVTLDSRGDLSLCSVQSEILGSALRDGASRVYRQHAPAERKRILRDHCADCQHDLVGPPPAAVRARELLDDALAPWRRWRRATLWPRLRRQAERSLARRRPATLPAVSHIDRPWRRVLVTGWYGTETQGDKAILGELFEAVGRRHPGCRFIVGSLDPRVSRQTARELDVDYQVTPLADAHHRAVIREVDAVIIGGGPLEQVAELGHLHRVFQAAARRGLPRIVFGCGVGPLHDEDGHALVHAILDLATAGFFRDQPSLDLAGSLGVPVDRFTVACDPALGYVRRWRARAASSRNRDAVPPAGDRVRLGAMLRANIPTYTQADAARGDLARRNADFADRCAHLLDHAADRLDATIELGAMHMLHVGGDDRLFARDVAGRMQRADRAVVQREYRTLHDCLRGYQTYDAVVAMRYHSHLFAAALGRPLLSIDYTGRAGKVRNLIDRLGWRDRAVDWSELGPDAADRLATLWRRRVDVARETDAQVDALLDRLAAGYEHALGLAPDAAALPPVTSHAAPVAPAHAA